MIHSAWVVKVVIGALIPKIVHDGYIYCKKEYNKLSHIKVKRKQVDKTLWTQYGYDVVMAKRKSWVNHNKNNTFKKLPLKLLIDDINHVLDINKSQRAIAAIWEGKIDRNTLAKGALTHAKRKQRN